MNGHEIAVWAGATAFFGSLLAIGIFDIFNPDQWVEYIGAIIVAVITAGSVYAKQRLDDAKSAIAPETMKESPLVTKETPPTTHQRSKPKK